ncbi:MAG TPA: hypothetical protein HA341_02700 [Halobacteria archaeon]|nr:hypothetical protein [Halobacteria archaeon]
MEALPTTGAPCLGRRMSKSSSAIFLNDIYASSISSVIDLDIGNILPFRSLLRASPANRRFSG